MCLKKMERILMIGVFLSSAFRYTGAFAQAKEIPEIIINLFFLTADLSEVKVEDLQRLEKLGASGFELPGTVSTMKDCQRLGKYIKSRHLLAGLNVAATLDNDPSSPDPRVRRAGLKYLMSRIDCAEALGAKILAGPIALPWGGFPDSDSSIDLKHRYLRPRIKNAASSMRLVAEYARKKGVSLALEPLTHWEMTGLNTLRETIEFVKLVDHENFGVTLDISHEVLDGDGPAIFARQVDELNRMGKIFYIQVSAPHRGGLKNSWLPWNDFFQPLKAIWQGPLAIEMMNAVPPFSAPNGGGLRLSRSPFKDPFLTVKEAIDITLFKWSEVE